MASSSPLLPVPSSPDPRPLPHGPPTVFVVDDDPAVLKSLSRLLRSAGLAVATFSSPREFLDRHDPNTPGCLVLDVAMPVGRAIARLSQLKSQ